MNLQNEQAVTILVGNKVDEERREVSEEEGEAKARNYEMGFCETSAKLGVGIDELFQSIIGNIRVLKKSE